MLPTKDNETGFLVFNMFDLDMRDPNMYDSDMYDRHIESMYWLAPDLYCGNKLQSYGSNLVFTISWVKRNFI